MAKKQHDRSKLSFDADEAADFLKIHRNTVLELAEKGELPGAKIGRAWVFVTDDLVEWLRLQVKQQQSNNRGDESPPQRQGGGKRQPLPQLPDLPVAG